MASAVRVAAKDEELPVKVRRAIKAVVVAEMTIEEPALTVLLPELY